MMKFPPRPENAITRHRKKRKYYLSVVNIVTAVKAKIIFGQQFVQRRTDLFAVVDIVSYEFIRCPVIERLMYRFERNKVMSS